MVIVNAMYAVVVCVSTV